MSNPTIRLDPITLQVVRNRLDMIVEEMESALIRASFSSIVKDIEDASAAIFDVQGNTLAQACATPTHLGTLIHMVQRIVKEFPPSTMQPGDVYIMNDPHDGGTHLPDISLTMPVFYEGEPVTLSAVVTHHQDVGGKSPGSTPPDATEIFAEGIIIPPMKLVDRGELDQKLVKLLRRNVRLPDFFVGDLMAQIACCKTGERRVLTLFAEYGKDATLRYYEELLDYADRLSRKSLSAIPQGEYTFFDYLDSNGVDPHSPVKIQATVKCHGSDLVVDFAGTDPQAKGAINCVRSTGAASVYFVVRAICGPNVPNNAGATRPIRIELPPGTVVNANFPAACGARSTTARRAASTMQGALARAIPDKIPASSEGCTSLYWVGGIDPKNGRRYVTQIAVPNIGGTGARPDRDGLTVTCLDNTNLARMPAEAFELDYPFRLVKCDIWTDSGGPGRWRGGLGYHAIVEMLRGESPVTMRRERQDFAPWGLFGGHAAPLSHTYIHRATGETEKIASMIMTRISAGDRIEFYTTGGGGHGDPLDREPWRVRDDVLDQAVSRESAERDYGVVLKGPAAEVDEGATAELRAAKATERGPINWTFDRGEGFTQRMGLPRYE